jgi:hypothetical protein
LVPDRDQPEPVDDRRRSPAPVTDVNEQLDFDEQLNVKEQLDANEPNLINKTRCLARKREANQKEAPPQGPSQPEAAHAGDVPDKASAPARSQGCPDQDLSAVSLDGADIREVPHVLQPTALPWRYLGSYAHIFAVDVCFQRTSRIRDCTLYFGKGVTVIVG